MAKKSSSPAVNNVDTEHLKALLISDEAAAYTLYKIQLAQYIAKAAKLNPKDISTIYNIIVLLVSAEADVRAAKNPMSILNSSASCCGGNHHDEGSIGVK